jgi:hypothetical protein
LGNEKEKIRFSVKEKKMVKKLLTLLLAIIVLAILVQPALAAPPREPSPGQGDIITLKFQYHSSISGTVYALVYTDTGIVRGRATTRTGGVYLIEVSVPREADYDCLLFQYTPGGFFFSTWAYKIIKPQPGRTTSVSIHPWGG